MMSDIRTSSDGLVGIVELNRPPDNFFDTPLIQDIAAALDGFVAAGMRSILLCSAGRNFCAGADFGRPADDEGRKRDIKELYRQAARLFRAPLPIVAAVNGAAVGGGLGLSMVSDFRVASAQSRFAANFSRLGIHAGFGLSVTLPRAIGEQKAALLFYTGRRINGEEAHAMGLVDILAPDGNLRKAALEFAKEIAQSSPHAVQAMRATLRQGLAERIAAMTEHELSIQAENFRTKDFEEGIKAMAERRLPNFTGH